MAIADVTPRVEYTADGTATVFVYPFRIMAATDLIVYVAGALVTSGFTVAGAGNEEGGSVTFGVAPSRGASVILQRNTPISRVTDFQTSGDFRAASLNDEYDRLVAICQQLMLRLQRALYPPDEALFSGRLPELIAGRALKVAADARSVEMSAYDPDVGIEVANAALAQAAAATASAVVATDAANAALQVVQALTSAQVTTASWVISSALETSFELPYPIPATGTVLVWYGGVGQDYGADYELTDVHGTRQTLHLLFTPAEGKKVVALLLGYAAINAIIQPRQVEGRHLADEAINDARVFAYGVIPAEALSLAARVPPAGAVPLASLAPGAEGQFIGYGAGGVATAVPAPSIPGNVNETQWFRAWHQTAANEDAGTFSAGGWRTRRLTNSAGTITAAQLLVTNSVRLPAGTYQVRWRCPAYRVGAHKSRLTVDGVVVADGSTARSYVDNLSQTDSVGECRLVLTQLSTLQLEHRCSDTKDTNGFGVGLQFDSSVHAEMWIERLG